MCSITGSFDKLIFDKLTVIGYSRGNFSHSITQFSSENFQIKKSFDKIISDPNKIFYLGHSQAPTGGMIKDTYRIHPAKEEGYYLYHNGILKQSYIDLLKEEFNTRENWDTLLLLKKIVKDEFKILSEIDGSFTGVLFSNSNYIYLFRNEITPLWIDKDFNFSSIKFENSFLIKENTIFELNLISKNLKEIGKFTTRNNPYNFRGKN